MAKIKSYSDLQQSKKLAEILPIESADMVLLHEEPYETSDSMFDGLHQALCVPFTKYDKSWRQKYKNISYFPCWSLASLLDVLPAECECMSLEHINYGNNHKKYFMSYVGGEYTDPYNNPVDACVAMIERLHELNLL